MTDEILILLDGWGYQAVRMLISLLWQSSILLAGVGALSLALRRHTAAARHALWTAGIFLAPLIPVIMLALFGMTTSRPGIAIMPEHAAPFVETQAAVKPIETPAEAEPVVVVQQTTLVNPLDYPWALTLAVYLLGASSMLALIALGRRRIARWKRSGRIITDRRILDVVTVTRERAGVSRTVLLIEHDDVPTPFTTGVLHPAILLPAGYAASLSENDLYALAVHELTHIRRRDPLTLAVLSVIRAALFCHPLVWIAARQAANEAEHACDEAVVAAVDDPVPYAEQLVRLSRRFPHPALHSEIAAGFVWSRHAFLRRVEAILSAKEKSIRTLSRAALAGIAGILCLALAVAVAVPLKEKPTAGTARPLEQTQLAQRGTARTLSVNGLTLDDLTGEWLNKQYYEALLATRSPKRSIMGICYTSMTFTKALSGNTYRWLRTLNFHEGLWFFISALESTGESGEYRPLFAGYQESGTNTENDQLIMGESVPSDEIEWRFTELYGDKNHLSIPFVRIPGGLDNFANRTVIAGRYTDEKNRVYEFTEDGTAVWPDTTFSYKIQIDTMFSQCDNFFVGKTFTEQKGTGFFRYGFSWGKNRLYLFRIHNEVNGPNMLCSSEPFAILTPIAATVPLKEKRTVETARPPEQTQMAQRGTARTPSVKEPGITFVSIPGGTFQMGDEVGDLNKGFGPVHTVTLSVFEMSTHEITNTQYAQYLNEALASGAIEVTDGDVYGKTVMFFGQRYLDLGYGRYGSGQEMCLIMYGSGVFSVESEYSNWPVVSVTWYGAEAFAQYYGFDLPTESEWEYAFRGGQQYLYGTYDGTIDIKKANYFQNGPGHPVDVGSYPANPYGLYDMSGNVFEWCHDWYGVYPSDIVTNPTGAQSGTSRVFRGGSWAGFNDGVNNCRSAWRHGIYPYDRLYFLGFRVVRRPGEVKY